MELIDLRKDLLYNEDVLKRSEIKGYISVEDYCNKISQHEIYHAKEEISNFAAGINEMDMAIGMNVDCSKKDVLDLVTHMGNIYMQVQKAGFALERWSNVDNLSNFQKLYYSMSEGIRDDHNKYRKSIIKEIISFEVYAEAQFALQTSDFYEKVKKDNNLTSLKWHGTSESKIIPKGIGSDTLFDSIVLLKRLKQGCEIEPDYHFMSRESNPFRRNVSNG
tara:strand:+ start:28781 stop:29440 length:660 start_codon:yes stop_codon:yes gene_type:complete